jgi:hypothetical protein
MMDRVTRSLILMAGLYVIAAGGLAAAQTFSSGSTGALGALNPITNTTIPLPPDGVLNYTTVTVPAGVTVSFAPNAANTPVTLLATGDVTLAGTITVNGANAVASSTTFASGGPGGFRSGLGAALGGSTTETAGSGPGGGTTTPLQRNGNYGAPGSFVSLIPLLGGSGGGGAPATSLTAGETGSGGGGAILMASSTTITVASTGTMTANGGNAGVNCFAGTSFESGAGSGGAIRLVAPEILGATGATLRANGGTLGCNNGTLPQPGRIRLESLNPGGFPTGNVSPVPSIAGAPGPVSPAGIPVLAGVPSITIASVGGQAATTNTGSYTTPDVSLPVGTPNPVPVAITAANVPLGTVLTVQVVPRLSATSTVNASALAGTFSHSTATANVTLPAAQVSVLNLFGSFTLPQIAGLFPLINGEEVDRVLLAATDGNPSSTVLVTKSGKEVPVSQLSAEDQLRVALAFEAMK